MQHAVCCFVFILLFAGFFRNGTCAVNGEWEYFDQVAFKPKKVCVDRLDRKWFAAIDGVRMLDGSSWTRYTQSSTGMPVNSVNAMEAADDGAIWFGTLYNGAFRFDGASWSVYNTDNSGIGNNRVNGFAFDREGGVWIVTPGDAVLLKNGRWSSYSADNYLGGYAGLTCAAVDATGRVWFGTGGEGALRFDGSAWRKFTDDNSGLAARVVNTIKVKPDGKIVFGSSYQANILDNSSWKTIPVYSAESVGFDEDGNMWLANEFSFWCYDGENLAEFPAYATPIGMGNTASQSTIYGMAPDREGNLWFATGKGVYRFTGRFVHIVQPGKPQSGEMSPVAAGTTLPIGWMSRRTGRVALDYSLDRGATWNVIASSLDALQKKFDWAIPNNFLPAGYLAATVTLRITAVGDTSLAHTVDIRVEAPGFPESMAEFTPYNSGLASYAVRAMTEDTAGVKWFATDQGVSRFDGAVWQTFTAANSGLASDDVTDCVPDGEGRLWFATSAGLSRYDGTKWNSWFAGKPVVRIGAGGSAVWVVCADSLDSVHHNPVNPILYRLENDGWIPHGKAPGDTLISDLRFDTVDPSGNLWFDRFVKAWDSPYSSVYRQQLLRYDGAEWKIYPLDDVLDSSERINTHIFDSAGKLWGLVEYSDALVTFDGTGWKRIQIDSGYGAGHPYKIRCDRENRVWGISNYGMYVLDGNRWKPWDEAHGWPVNQVGWINGIFIDHEDVKWLLGGSGVTRFDSRLVPVEERKEQPRRFGITGNFPNPFNPSTAIRFSLAAPGKVDLAVYDILGRKVRTLSTAYLEAGSHTVYWDGRDDRGALVSSGVYFARLQCGSLVSTARMLLMK